MKNLIVLVLVFFTAICINAQDDIKMSKTKGFKIGIGVGESYYTNSQSGTTLGIDITAPISGRWQITAFGEKNKKPAGASDKHTHYGVVAGQRFSLFQRLEFSYGVGLGYISRSTEEHFSYRTGEIGFLGLPEYSHYTKIDEFNGFTLPIKLGLDLKIVKHLSLGIYTRTTYHNRPVFGTVNAAVGLHF